MASTILSPVIELQQRYESRPSIHEEVIASISQESHDSGGQLEPTDGGRAAWTLLWAAFTFEAILWGFSLSFGVFQNYYAKTPEFANNPFIPIVGSVASGVPYLGAPFASLLVKRFQKHQRLMIWLGWPICISGLLAGSFASTLPALIMTQGIMYGLGFVMLYYPIISMVNEWWVTRRGFAWGIIASASGASGAIFPFIVEALLNRYGYRITLRALAVAMIILTGPLLPFFKGRLPPSEQSALARTDWSFLKNRLFWIYCTSTVAQGLGFFFPSLYLPSYASSLGFSPRIGALLLALMSMSQVIGQFTFGFLSDERLSVNILAFSSTIVAAVVSFTLWGLARSLAPLILFSLIYGFFAYGFAALRVRMGTAVSSDPTAALATFSIFVFGQGLGSVLAGPISVGLLSRETEIGPYGLNKYREIVVFTGCCMVLSAFSICFGLFGKRRQI